MKVSFEDGAEEAFMGGQGVLRQLAKIDSVPSTVLARRARDDALKAGEFEVRQYARAA